MYLFIYCLIIEHESIEPRRDSFRFQVRDAVANRSPIVQLDIVIEVNIYLYTLIDRRVKINLEIVCILEHQR